MCKLNLQKSRSDTDNGNWFLDLIVYNDCSKFENKD